MEKKTIGGFIAALRRTSGMTQKELGEMLGVSDKAVSRWERDECAPDLTLIPVLAEIFGVTSDEILRGQRLNVSEAESDFRDKRTDKQISRLIHNAGAKLSNNSIISVGIAVAGLLAAMICNSGFNRAYVGFFLSCVFYAGAAVCQSIFTLSAFNSISGDSIQSDELNSVKYSMAKVSFRAFFAIAILFAFSLPLVIFPYDGYVGLELGYFLLYGAIFAVAMSVIALCVRPLIFCRLIRYEVFTLSEKENNDFAAVSRITGYIFGVTLCIILITFFFDFLITSRPNTDFVDGTVFESFEDFKDFMETPVEAVWTGYSAYEIVGAYYDENGNVISEDEALGRTLRDSTGKVIGTYVWRNNSVATMHYSSITADDFRVTVYTNADSQRGAAIKSGIQAVFYMVYIAEIIIAAVVYTVLYRKITRSPVDK